MNINTQETASFYQGFGQRSPSKDDKEKFYSSDSAFIHMGRHKKDDNQRNFKSDFLVHDSDGKAQINHQQSFSNESRGGLEKTRFHKGFQRRLESSISNPISERIQSYKLSAIQTAQEKNERRTQFLSRVDNYNGYNIITGVALTERPSVVTKTRTEGLKYLGDGLGPEAPARARIILNNSTGHFFTPHSSGPAHEYRQHVLQNEGHFEPRTSSIIELGKKDIPSHGLEDQFSKSNYAPKSQLATIGLCETRQVGKFTPRKQNPPGLANPWASGGDSNAGGAVAAVSSWGKGIPHININAGRVPVAPINNNDKNSVSEPAKEQRGNINPISGAIMN